MSDAPAARRAGPPPRSADERRSPQLEATWQQPPGLLGLAPQRGPQVDRPRATSSPRSCSSCWAGLEAAVMRAQLARPENTSLGPDAYNQFFTMHGTTMMFLFAVPVMDGDRRSTWCRS